MSLSQPLRSFPSLKDFYELLESYGCYTLEDALDRISIFKNKTELSKILNVISNAPKPWKKSITNNYTSPNTLKTFNSSLDNALGGGFPLGCVIEVFGPGGVGKTQFAKQLCCTVQLPSRVGGLEGKALYLDTECSFYPKRFDEIASGAMKVLIKQNIPTFSMSDNVYIRKIRSSQELIDTLESLTSSDEFFQDTRLLVVDSVTFHFRFQEKMECSLSNTCQVFKVLSLLNRFALKRKSVVLLTNQMTTQIIEGSYSVDTAALGENWSHSCAAKVHLDFHPKRRKIRSLQMVKCMYKDMKDMKTVHYCITQDGIRDASSKFIDKLYQMDPDDDCNFSY
ncbi:uncharacterized protein [Lepeophtheirus salmonis]|uniref:uncharacterized protein n=1 Tax=Lepeophtheirus salmonis TaxID=72036 RepID=UPI001AE11F5F|nr:DNA repair protein RAD51 homolog 3-like [Lepeophtheirus salmonis]